MLRVRGQRAGVHRAGRAGVHLAGRAGVHLARCCLAVRVPVALALLCCRLAAPPGQAGLLVLVVLVQPLVAAG